MELTSRGNVATAAEPTEHGVERQIRDRLGVPASATDVVVVAESSHWDPNWLLSADRYYRWCVRPTLDRVLQELAAEPRRVFGIECVFFVERYWEDRPERRDQFRDLVNEGRLRFTGSGVTTPDTLLPDDELLLRDLLIGQEWLRERGMDQEPRLLYLPDSFGHSPGLPALLRAAGMEYAAVCRIDGMRFPGADLESAARFPRPGSSAARLFEEGTADFVWRAADGSEVLTHWMSHGYGHGDMIASGGISRVMGLPVSWSDRRPDRVDRRIEGYLADLAPLTRTPYRLLSVGFDFVRPVSRLVDLLDGWNERHHDRTGTWLVNAGLDDHLDLVAAHRASLPTIDFDPNPYWMGFYATRPDLKARSRELGRRLIATDIDRAVRSLDAAGSVALDRASRSAWWTAATSNHHDFVTGTAPDRVARGEQARWLAEAIESTPWPASPGADQPAEPAEPLAEGGAEALLFARRDGPLVVVTAPWGTATFDPRRGGAMVSLTDSSGTERLAGPSLELVSYAESGGLWRMGQELRGGHWSLADRSSRHHAVIDVEVGDEARSVEVSVRPVVDGRVAHLRHTFRADDPAIVTASSVHAPARRTVTLVMRPAAPAATVRMHQPGGLVDRPLHRWYEPTFWPLHSFAACHPEPSAPDDGADRLVLATATPTGLHVEPDGTAEVIVARTAIKEIAFGVVPVMAPAWGLRWGRQDAVIAVGWNRSAASAVSGAGTGTADRTRLGRHLTRLVDRAVEHRDPAIPILVGDPDVEPIAVKPAHRGEGTIVRLRDWASTGAERHVHLALSSDLAVEVVSAHLTDSRERDISSLTLGDHDVVVPLQGHLTTIRLITSRLKDVT